MDEREQQVKTINLIIAQLQNGIKNTIKNEKNRTDALLALFEVSCKINLPDDNGGVLNG